MRLKILTTSIVIGWALLMLAHAGSAQTATTDTSRGLSIRYADGRTTTTPIRPKGAMMTAVFPRIDGVETARESMSLRGLEVSHIVEGGEVVVTVSLLYRRGPDDKAVSVATRRLVAGRPMEVDELRRYGVEPIVLSIASIPSTYAFAPRGISASADVDVRATPIGPNAAAYRVTITNRAPVPLMWFRFEAHRSEGPPASALPRGKRDFPLVMPNDEYTFELPMGRVSQSYGDDTRAWQPLDHIEVTSLMWQDGVVEGDKETARQKYAFDTQRSAHIRALLKILRGTSRSITALRDDISRTRPPDVELKQARDGLIEQLDRFAGQHMSTNGLEFETWLGRTVMDQEQWLARIVFPKL
jgi:hypothetical protein